MSIGDKLCPLKLHQEATHGFTLATDLVPGCKTDQILTDDWSLTIQAHSTAATVACPNCAQLSSSVHTYYTRSPQDLPIGAKVVRLPLRVRRFRCHNSSCAKRTFSERLPQLLQPYAQKIERFITALYHTAQALGGAAAARLLVLLQLPTSATTLLRIIRRLFGRSSMQEISTNCGARFLSWIICARVHSYLK